jgi:hypothetical protein
MGSSDETVPMLGRWLPIAVVPDVRDQLPIAVPDEAWFRLIADPRQGLPAAHVELGWVTGSVLHLATVAGFTLSEDADGVDEAEVLGHRRIPLETISGATPDLRTMGGPVELTSGEVINEGPAALVREHLPSSG